MHLVHTLFESNPLGLLLEDSIADIIEEVTPRLPTGGAHLS